MPGCYRYETVRCAAAGGPTLFGSVVDGAYVLLMENSKREAGVRAQLAEHAVVPEIDLQFNKGYKKCHKPELPAEMPSHDLMHATITAFRTALERGQRRVLVLEDDFEIEPTCAADAKEVCAFIRKHSPDVYNLGPFGALAWPIAAHRPLGGYIAGTQGVIYSESYMRWAVDRYAADPIARTDDMIVHSPATCYAYHRTLVSQTLPATENRADWGNDALDLIIRKLRLDTSTKHFNLFSQLAVWLPAFVFVAVGTVLLAVIAIAVAVRIR